MLQIHQDVRMQNQNNQLKQWRIKVIKQFIPLANSNNSDVIPSILKWADISFNYRMVLKNPTPQSQTKFEYALYFSNFQDVQKARDLIKVSRPLFLENTISFKYGSNFKSLFGYISKRWKSSVSCLVKKKIERYTAHQNKRNSQNQTNQQSMTINTSYSQDYYIHRNSKPLQFRNNLSFHENQQPLFLSDIQIFKDRYSYNGEEFGNDYNNEEIDRVIKDLIGSNNNNNEQNYDEIDRVIKELIGSNKLDQNKSEDSKRKSLQKNECNQSQDIYSNTLSLSSSQKNEKSDGFENYLRSNVKNNRKKTSEQSLGVNEGKDGINLKKKSYDSEDDGLPQPIQKKICSNMFLNDSINLENLLNQKKKQDQSKDSSLFEGIRNEDILIGMDNSSITSQNSKQQKNEQQCSQLGKSVNFKQTESLISARSIHLGSQSNDKNTNQQGQHFNRQNALLVSEVGQNSHFILSSPKTSINIQQNQQSNIQTSQKEELILPNEKHIEVQVQNMNRQRNLVVSEMGQMSQLLDSQLKIYVNNQQSIILNNQQHNQQNKESPSNNQNNIEVYNQNNYRQRQLVVSEMGQDSQFLGTQPQININNQQMQQSVILNNQQDCFQQEESVVIPNTQNNQNYLNIQPVAQIKRQIYESAYIQEDELIQQDQLGNQSIQNDNKTEDQIKFNQDSIIQNQINYINQQPFDPEEHRFLNLPSQQASQKSQISLIVPNNSEYQNNSLSRDNTKSLSHSGQESIVNSQNNKTLQQSVHQIEERQLAYNQQQIPDQIQFQYPDEIQPYLQEEISYQLQEQQAIQQQENQKEQKYLNSTQDQQYFQINYQSFQDELIEDHLTEQNNNSNIINTEKQISQKHSKDQEYFENLKKDLQKEKSQSSIDISSISKKSQCINQNERLMSQSTIKCKNNYNSFVNSLQSSKSNKMQITQPEEFQIIELQEKISQIQNSIEQIQKQENHQKEFFNNNYEPILQQDELKEQSISIQTKDSYQFQNNQNEQHIISNIEINNSIPKVQPKERNKKETMMDYISQRRENLQEQDKYQNQKRIDNNISIYLQRVEYKCVGEETPPETIIEMRLYNSISQEIEIQLQWKEFKSEIDQTEENYLQELEEQQKERVVGLSYYEKYDVIIMVKTKLDSDVIGKMNVNLTSILDQDNAGKDQWIICPLILPNVSFAFINIQTSLHQNCENYIENIFEVYSHLNTIKHPIYSTYLTFPEITIDDLQRIEMLADRMKYNKKWLQDDLMEGEQQNHLICRNKLRQLKRQLSYGFLNKQGYFQANLLNQENMYNCILANINKNNLSKADIFKNFDQLSNEGIHKNKRQEMYLELLNLRDNIQQIRIDFINYCQNLPAKRNEDYYANQPQDIFVSYELNQSQNEVKKLLNEKNLLKQRDQFYQILYSESKYYDIQFEVDFNFEFAEDKQMVYRIFRTFSFIQRISKSQTISQFYYIYHHLLNKCLILNNQTKTHQESESFWLFYSIISSFYCDVQLLNKWFYLIDYSTNFQRISNIIGMDCFVGLFSQYFHEEFCFRCWDIIFIEKKLNRYDLLCFLSSIGVALCNHYQVNTQQEWIVLGKYFCNFQELNQITKNTYVNLERCQNNYDILIKKQNQDDNIRYFFLNHQQIVHQYVTHYNINFISSELEKIINELLQNNYYRSKYKISTKRINDCELNKFNQNYSTQQSDQKKLLQLQRFQTNQNTQDTSEFQSHKSNQYTSDDQSTHFFSTPNNKKYYNFLSNQKSNSNNILEDYESQGVCSPQQIQRGLSTATQSDLKSGYQNYQLQLEKQSSNPQISQFSPNHQQTNFTKQYNSSSKVISPQKQSNDKVPQSSRSPLDRDLQYSSKDFNFNNQYTKNELQEDSSLFVGQKQNQNLVNEVNSECRLDEQNQLQENLHIFIIKLVYKNQYNEKINFQLYVGGRDVLGDNCEKIDEYQFFENVEQTPFLRVKANILGQTYNSVIDLRAFNRNTMYNQISFMSEEGQPNQIIIEFSVYIETSSLNSNFSFMPNLKKQALSSETSLKQKQQFMNYPLIGEYEQKQLHNQFFSNASLNRKHRVNLQEFESFYNQQNNQMPLQNNMSHFVNSKNIFNRNHRTFNISKQTNVQNQNKQEDIQNQIADNILFQKIMRIVEPSKASSFINLIQDLNENDLIEIIQYLIIYLPCSYQKKLKVLYKLFMLRYHEQTSEDLEAFIFDFFLKTSMNFYSYGDMQKTLQDQFQNSYKIIQSKLSLSSGSVFDISEFFNSKITKNIFNTDNLDNININEPLIIEKILQNITKQRNDQDQNFSIKQQMHEHSKNKNSQIQDKNMQIKGKQKGKLELWYKNEDRILKKEVKFIVDEFNKVSIISNNNNQIKQNGIYSKNQQFIRNKEIYQCLSQLGDWINLKPYVFIDSFDTFNKFINGFKFLEVYLMKNNMCNNPSDCLNASTPLTFQVIYKEVNKIFCDYIYISSNILNQIKQKRSVNYLPHATLDDSILSILSRILKLSTQYIKKYIAAIINQKIVKCYDAPLKTIVSEQDLINQNQVVQIKIKQIKKPTNSTKYQKQNIDQTQTNSIQNEPKYSFNGYSAWNICSTKQYLSCKVITQQKIKYNKIKIEYNDNDNVIKWY